MRRVLSALSLIGLVFIAASCKDESGLIVEENSQSVQVLNAQLSDEYLEHGEASVKVTAALAAELESNTDDDGMVVIRNVKSLSSAVKELGIVRMTRLFPYAGEFEARTREAGLHLWYEVSFDESRTLTKAGGDLSCIPGVSLVELHPKIGIVGNPEVIEYVDAQPAPQASSSDLPFNDPRLKDQWHYYNTGSGSGAQGGCDVNVFPVWKNYTTGNSNIIVAVVDGGVDFKHEDLADNMWHNPKMSGDGQYGFNFVTNSYVINPEDHGTHVAGTIAAVNNNGKGVCGIAGGDAGNNKKGVKIMSCQIFDGSKSASGATAIKWSCDHGAVISQNSWGSTAPGSTSQGLREAVDYFIKYAGFDANGNQTGPMAGGIVIFAAGNDNSSQPYGTDYEKMVIVTSVAADYKRAYYSNYGSWVHIAAPGGDYKKGCMVLSTLPDNKYGYMQGTSMACPHVSGVAALVLSKLAAQGFTGEALRDRLIKNVTDITAYNRTTYMGSGLVNAYRALAASGGKAPDAVKTFSVEPQSNNINFSAVVPSDSDDGKPTAILVYYGTSDFSSTSGQMFAQFYVGDLNVGETLTGTIKGLEFNQSYYLSAVAMDLAGNKSAMSSVKTAYTGANNPPYINTTSPLDYQIKAHETVYLNMTAGDPDGHYCRFELNKASEAETLDTLDTSKPVVSIAGVKAPAGKYKSSITVTDYYGLSSSLEFSYTILENHPPVIVTPIPDQCFGKRNETLELNASDFINDEDGEILSYKITNTDENVANVNYSKGVIYITSLGYGYSEVSITATDIREKSITQTFKILVRDGSVPMDIYPNPVKDVLYVRTTSACDASIRLVSTTGAVVYQNTLPITPFSPAQIDVRSLAGGRYTVIVESDGVSVSKTVVKL